MKKTARVIITSKCDRKCPGCCNSKLDYTSLAKVIGVTGDAQIIQKDFVRDSVIGIGAENGIV